MNRKTTHSKDNRNRETEIERQKERDREARSNNTAENNCKDAIGTNHTTVIHVCSIRKFSVTLSSRESVD